MKKERKHIHTVARKRISNMHMHQYLALDPLFLLKGLRSGVERSKYCHVYNFLCTVSKAIVVVVKWCHS